MPRFVETNISQSQTLVPLLVKIGKTLGDLHLDDDECDTDHLSPAVYMTVREWRRILETFETNASR
jgi:hypothetical protein